jgi:hypothetical protein
MARKGFRRTRIVSLGVPLTILGIDANFEPVTQAGFQYRQTNVYPYVQGKGFTLQLCQGSMARRVYVAPAARQAGVVYITGIGHGTPTRSLAIITIPFSVSAITRRKSRREK